MLLRVVMAGLTRIMRPPTTKALIDGITDFGVWPDDNDLWVVGPDHRRGEGVAPLGVRKVRLVITELEPRGEL